MRDRSEQRQEWEQRLLEAPGPDVQVGPWTVTEAAQRDAESITAEGLPWRLVLTVRPDDAEPALCKVPLERDPSQATIEMARQAAITCLARLYADRYAEDGVVAEWAT
jgi:hypothetical protein